jgi:hypothetical protein
VLDSLTPRQRAEKNRVSVHRGQCAEIGDFLLLTCCTLHLDRIRKGRSKRLGDAVVGAGMCCDRLKDRPKGWADGPWQLVYMCRPFRKPGHADPLHRLPKAAEQITSSSCLLCGPNSDRGVEPDRLRIETDARSFPVGSTWWRGSAFDARHRGCCDRQSPPGSFCPKRRLSQARMGTHT